MSRRYGESPYWKHVLLVVFLLGTVIVLTRTRYALTGIPRSGSTGRLTSDHALGASHVPDPSPDRP